MLALGIELLVFFVELAQLFFQPALSEHVFKPAPRGFATFAGRFDAPIHAIEQPIEFLRLILFRQEVVVDVEVFPVALAHVPSVVTGEKASEISEIALFPSGEEAADYIRIGIRFKTLMQRQRHFLLIREDPARLGRQAYHWLYISIA